jgi:hypothetical protein
MNGAENAQDCTYLTHKDCMHNVKNNYRHSKILSRLNYSGIIMCAYVEYTYYWFARSAAKLWFRTAIF